ncbi:MAG TPA: histidine phosphatase family protein [Acidimicrobiales bacterium]|nr:histidine phosphatase family protein [Acidimicrobiales bacterium]
MLILVRHGESTGNAAGLLLGRIDAPLTERGLAQAQMLGSSLSGVTRVISSPLARARDTAAALDLGLPIEIDDRWVELDYGEFDGQPLGSVPSEVWQRWRSDPHYRPPGGETLAEAGVRVRSACEDLFAGGESAEARAGNIVVVSHVSPIKAAVCWAMGLGDEGSWRLYLATASITRIAWGAGATPVLQRFNETPWQDGPGEQTRSEPAR